jgi:hypothetical protein
MKPNDRSMAQGGDPRSLDERPTRILLRRFSAKAARRRRRRRGRRAGDISDHRIRDLLLAERTFPLLGAGQIVRMSVIETSGLPARLCDAVVRDGRMSYVEVKLLGDLSIRLRGSQPARLELVDCEIPTLQKRAKSLNEAYRIISEQFEPERRSHSGNVFELALAKSQDGWRRLEVLRDSSSSPPTIERCDGTRSHRPIQNSLVAPAFVSMRKRLV